MPQGIPSPDTTQAAPFSETELVPQAKVSPPLVTMLYVGACVCIYLGLLVANDYSSIETLAHFGLMTADRIWGGAYFGLVTSAAVHFQLWHLALNLYWLWILGRPLEQALGAWRYLAFLIVSAFVSSSYQLAVSDSTGIGASGVGYAMFGFLWVTRDKYPQFRVVLPWKVIRFFNTWLLLCFVLTFFGIMDFGNAAHLTGLLFGAAIGGITSRSRKRELLVVGVASLLIGAVIPLFWAPWSVTWNMHRAYTAHVDLRYRDALAYYTRVIEQEPENAWAYLNRSIVHQTLLNIKDAEADKQKALEFDPHILDEPKEE
jgi:rhomboid protease GluP